MLCAPEDKEIRCVEETHLLAAGIKHLKDVKTFLLFSLTHSFSLFTCFIQTVLVSLFSSQVFFLQAHALVCGCNCVCVCASVYACERVKGVSFVV